jgi:pantoate--beta-alanine ligase
MEIIRIPRIMHDTSRGHLMHGRSIGFVPTMGALHEGHLHLVRRSMAENDVTVVSIYVNPLQFGPAEDFNKYPRDIDADTAALRQTEIDVVFLPDDSIIYPNGYCTYIEVKNLSDKKLCGAFRPGHFKGVATVVAKLLNIVTPTRAYFGQKDFQQSVIIKKMVSDLDMGLEVVICPTLREPDGLAMSSRNQYLREDERKAATVIYQCLIQTAEKIKSGIIDIKSIKKFMVQALSKETLVSEIQYASAYDMQTLDEIKKVEKEAVLAIALKIGETRLIDNMLVKI